MSKVEDDLKHYEKLLGFNDAFQLLYARHRASVKLEKIKAKSRSEGLASSKPDGRLNAQNLSLNSIVCKMGGKRKLKKTKRGF